MQTGSRKVKYQTGCLFFIYYLFLFLAAVPG